MTKKRIRGQQVRQGRGKAALAAQRESEMGTPRHFPKSGARRFGLLTVSPYTSRNRDLAEDEHRDAGRQKEREGGNEGSMRGGGTLTAVSVLEKLAAWRHVITLSFKVYNASCVGRREVYLWDFLRGLYTGETLCVRDVMRRCFCDAIAHRDDVTSYFTPLGVQATDGTHARCPTVDVDDTQKVAAHWAMKQRECYVDLLCESMEEEVVAMVTQVGRQEPLLFEACAQGDFVLVASLLKHCRRYQDVSLNTKSEAGHSPLILATLANAGSTVRLLIEAKADANMKGLYGRSSLLIAAHRGYRDIVKILITEFSSLVDVNVEDRHAQTPLLAAAFHGFDDIVADLLNAGAQVRVDNHGNDPYMLAKQRRQ